MNTVDGLQSTKPLQNNMEAATCQKEKPQKAISCMIPGDIISLCSTDLRDFPLALYG